MRRTSSNLFRCLSKILLHLEETTDECQQEPNPLVHLNSQSHVDGNHFEEYKTYLRLVQSIEWSFHYYSFQEGNFSACKLPVEDEGEDVELRRERFQNRLSREKVQEEDSFFPVVAAVDDKKKFGDQQESQVKKLLFEQLTFDPLEQDLESSVSCKEMSEAENTQNRVSLVLVVEQTSDVCCDSASKTDMVVKDT